MTHLQKLCLVHKSAQDMHAYIVQCIDIQYGESDVRVLSKDSGERDLLLQKGGITSYSEIDVQALRQSQSSQRSTAKQFKPEPDGFEIYFGRKVLPAGDTE